MPAAALDNVVNDTTSFIYDRRLLYVIGDAAQHRAQGGGGLAMAAILALNRALLSRILFLATPVPLLTDLIISPLLRLEGD